mmetsp:Transcript_32417/g.64249  ORF Transcript_32417/g.64249 Transcript_32417/m.64249 type:complete len:619 (+) Transcript_32417:112-1968(+)|eukprot:CAMPEP_0194320088 /NCGR_PEP_ID=MMETSP0171-20130528/16470_1 /TAXON_ID=218684 /ORGANISM="Corethron pennatum, Strain L29A3" /LENGTH=618 /DNA_ID=CAMNT_0039077529 /DNA_START=41 /DNA_END=1900 /DNA_ORIENTATION=+
MTERNGAKKGGPGSAAAYGGSGRNIFLRKPLWALPAEDLALMSGQVFDGPAAPSPMSETNPLLGEKPAAKVAATHLERHLTLLDLVVIGVGSTVGSGIFVLCGLIARNYAGPAVSLSWAISGASAALSGICFAELAGRIPISGSAYSYVYIALGEWPAFLAAAGLTLEFLVCASAVARSWGDKVVEYLATQIHAPDFILRHLGGPYGEAAGGPSSDAFLSAFNPMAALISAAAVLILLAGVKESKAVNAFFTYTKMAVMSFMTIGGFLLFSKSNLSPFLPPQFGSAGVLRGATSSFFGYLGFDEICCLGGEAVNPRVDMPRAVLWTLGITSSFYIAASLALTGMVPYYEISVTSGFPAAFTTNGAGFAAQIAALGELISLPAVVFVTIMAQPRLMHALSSDGLLPKSLGAIDTNGNLTNATWGSGIVMVLIAAFVPFSLLDDSISAGVLVCYSLTDTSLLVLRLESPPGRPVLLERLVISYNVASFVGALAIVHLWGTSSFGNGIVLFFSGAAAILCVALNSCPEAEIFGGAATAAVFAAGSNTKGDSGYFRAPFMPYLPCAAIFLNYYLIAQLGTNAVVILLAYFAITSTWYLTYGLRNSIGNNGGWKNNTVVTGTC